MTQQRTPFTAELQRTKQQGSNGPAPADGSPRALLDARSAGQTVDAREAMEAIGELHQKLDRFLSMDHQQIENIQAEIAEISGRIKATKVEMAQLRHPLAPDDKFRIASQELTQVVAATEQATNTIMQHAEEIDEVIQEVRTQVGDGYAASRLRDIHDSIVGIYEACNFQDLTGQRITKVVNTLEFNEERVDSMISLWNRREFEAMPLPPSTYKKDGDLELHGPKDKSEMPGSISQAKIDALFD